MSLYRKLIFVISTFCLLIGCQKVEIDTGNNSGTDGQPGDSDIISGEPTVPCIDTIYIKGVAPRTCSLWSNHVVIFSEEDDEYDGAYFVVLLARNEFSSVCSANNTEKPTHAYDLTSHYSEEDITGWSVPSVDIAEVIIDLYGGADGEADALNTLLEGYTVVSVNNEVRYLCDDAKKSFSLAEGTKMAAAGATKTYSLRPVKLLYFIDTDRYTGVKNENENDDVNENENVNDDDNGGTDVNPPSVTSDNCFLWKGHAVVRYDKNTSTALLISQEEWKGLAAELPEKAKSYSEDGLTDWHVPTVKEAEYLMNTYSINSADFDSSTVTETLNWGDLAPLQAILDVPIIPRANGKNYRFLCDDGKKTFPFVEGLKILTAGSKTTYYLRIVKEIVIEAGE